jgi:hypothetical protein
VKEDIFSLKHAHAMFDDEFFFDGVRTDDLINLHRWQFLVPDPAGRPDGVGKV